MTKTNDKLDEILEQFARWTIQNVEHGIYIPLPSPEATQAIEALIKERELEARIDELKNMPNHTSANLYVRDRIAELNGGNKDE